MAFWLTLAILFQISVPKLPTPTPLNLSALSAEESWEEGQVRVWKSGTQVLTEVKIRGLKVNEYRTLYRDGLSQSGCSYQALSPETPMYSFGWFACSEQKRSGWAEIFSSNLENPEIVSRVVEFQNEKISAEEADQASLLLADLQQHPQWFWTKTRRLVNSDPKVFETAEWSECQRASPDLIARIKESLNRKDRKCQSEEDGLKKTYVCDALKDGNYEMTYSFYATGSSCLQTRALANPISQAAAP